MTAARRAIAIGLDGFEPKIVERMWAAGSLPNLRRLRDEGGFARLQTTCPAVTPVACSTFATGANPGVHGIFDFVRRDPRTYLPDISLNRYEQKNPYLPAKAVNLRRGEALWDLLTRAGIPSVVLRCPCTFPPDNIRGRMLSGMGVPDLRGGQGTSTFYSTEEVQPRESEHVVRLREVDGQFETHVVGPRHPRTRTDVNFPIRVIPNRAARSVAVLSEGAPPALELREGEWSDWIRVKFKLGLLQSVRGMVRFHLVRLEPHVELYASPINFDPDAPAFPISSPSEYSKELSDRIGTYYTTGMVEDHGGLNNGRLDEAAYLEQCSGVLRERERMLLYELERFDAGFLFCMFDTPDRVQHMFWRFREPDHPANAEDFRPELASAIESHYEACDRLVGRVLEAASGETLVLVFSDHGFSSFRRGVHLNTWLHENGFLVLKEGARPHRELGEFLRAVDWARTRAYALGLSGIYLNLAGREERGIVTDGDADGIKAAVADGLRRLVDRAAATQPIRSVVSSERVYAGPYASEAPDLIVNFAEGYRISWTTALGGIPEGCFEDNVKKWGGDHIVDPSLVPGVLLANRAFRGDGPRLVDLAPTILAALGAPRGDHMEGESLLL